MTPSNLTNTTPGDLVNMSLSNTLTQSQIDVITEELGNVNHIEIQNITTPNDLKINKENVVSMIVFIQDSEDNLIKTTWYSPLVTGSHPPEKVFQDMLKLHNAMGAAALVCYKEGGVYGETLLCLKFKR